jgi:hypothetical protein
MGLHNQKQAADQIEKLLASRFFAYSLPPNYVLKFNIKNKFINKPGERSTRFFSVLEFIPGLIF